MPWPCRSLYKHPSISTRRCISFSLANHASIIQSISTLYSSSFLFRNPNHDARLSFMISYAQNPERKHTNTRFRRTLFKPKSNPRILLLNPCFRVEFHSHSQCSTLRSD